MQTLTVKALNGFSTLSNEELMYIDAGKWSWKDPAELVLQTTTWQAGLRAGTLITHLNAKRVSEYSIEGIKFLIGGSSSAVVGAIIGGTASGCVTAIRLAGESLSDNNSRSAEDTGRSISDSMIDALLQGPYLVFYSP